VSGGTLTFSPDSKLLAVETGYGVVRLVDPDSGREYARLEDPNQDSVSQGMSFTPDGSQLVTTSNDSYSVHVWDLRAIRTQLAKMGLDWDLPSYPPTQRIDNRQPLQIQIDSSGSTVDRQEVTRQVIDKLRRTVEANPNNAPACNNLAWTYLTAPEALRDWNAALSLAQKAMQLVPNPTHRNTLGLAYYRAGRYREAVETLEANFKDQPDWALAYDLYFLAMCHQKLGDSARARQCFELALRWSDSHQDSLAPYAAELNAFRVEAGELLGIGKTKD
jgi:tetratricopeptide (TPR) repeat protein